VLREVAHGLSNRETAQRLVLSEATVTYVTRIIAKFGTQGRAQGSSSPTGGTRPD
jgi:DNA-binding NarL/FixJ family response regulator